MTLANRYGVRAFIRFRVSGSSSAGGSHGAFGRRLPALGGGLAGLKQGKPLPGELVFEVEAKTGISRHELRPDLYPRDLAPFPAESIEPESSSE
jgi:hypothetical protein